MNRKQSLAKMRELEMAEANLTPDEQTELAYLRTWLYPLHPSEMLAWELEQEYGQEHDDPDPKGAMRMSGKGTRRVAHVLSGRAIY